MLFSEDRMLSQNLTPLQTGTYFSGILFICLSFPYIILFGNDETISSLACLGLYSQSLAYTLWTVCYANECFARGVRL